MRGGRLASRLPWSSVPAHEPRLRSHEQQCSPPASGRTLAPSLQAALSLSRAAAGIASRDGSSSSPPGDGANISFFLTASAAIN